MRLRRLTTEGVASFREFLAEARLGGVRPPVVPTLLLTLAGTSEEISDSPELEALPAGTSGYELARYLNEQFEQLARSDSSVIEGVDGFGDPGFWAAVALFYFDLISPGYRSGREKPKADNCYISESATALGAGVRYFRHRMAGPYRLYKLHGRLSEPLLLSPADAHSALYNKITDSGFFTATRCIVEAVNALYFDARRHRLKRDWNATNKPGALPRLLAIVNQLDLTYDMLGLSGEALIAQLPEEFEEWLPGARL